MLVLFIIPHSLLLFTTFTWSQLAVLMPNALLLSLFLDATHYREALNFVKGTLSVFATRVGQSSACWFNRDNLR